MTEYEDRRKVKARSWVVKGSGEGERRKPLAEIVALGFGTRAEYDMYQVKEQVRMQRDASIDDDSIQDQVSDTSGSDQDDGTGDRDDRSIIDDLIVSGTSRTMLDELNERSRRKVKTLQEGGGITRPEEMGPRLKEGYPGYAVLKNMVGEVVKVLGQEQEENKVQVDAEGRYVSGMPDWESERGEQGGYMVGDVIFDDEPPFVKGGSSQEIEEGSQERAMGTVDVSGRSYRTWNGAEGFLRLWTDSGWVEALICSTCGSLVVESKWRKHVARCMSDPE